jgi:hypothetical protein
MTVYYVYGHACGYAANYYESPIRIYVSERAARDHTTRANAYARKAQSEVDRLRLAIEACATCDDEDPDEACNAAYRALFTFCELYSNPYDAGARVVEDRHVPIYSVDEMEIMETDAAVPDVVECGQNLSDVPTR